MDREERDLGGLGQTEFEHLCGAYPGAVTNKAGIDRRGWDYIVEFPYPRHPLPYDMRPAPPVAVVQVKATEGKRKPSIRVKLSNAMRFASRLDPCFYVLFVYDRRSPRPIAAYVRHVWGELIEQAILRSRELEVDGRTDHHRTMVTIRFEEEHRVGLGDVISLVHRTSSEKGTQYAEEKAKQLFFSGVREDGLGKFGLRFPNEVTEDDLVDLSLGLRETVPCEGVVAYSERFGIPLRAPLLDVGPSLLAIDTDAPVGATIVFSGLSSGDIVCSAGVLAPQFPLRDESKRRVRVRGPFLDLVLKLDDLRIERAVVELATDRRVSLDELEQYLRLVLDAAGRETAFQLLIDARPAFWGSLRMPPCPQSASAWQPVLAFVQLLRRHMPRARAPQDFGFSVADVTHDFEGIRSFLQLTSSERMTIEAPCEDDRRVEGHRTSMFYSVAVRVGRYAICAQMARLGQVVPVESGDMALVLRQPKVLTVLAFEGSIEPDELKRVLDLDMHGRSDVMDPCYGDVQDVAFLDGPVPSSARESNHETADEEATL